MDAVFKALADASRRELLDRLRAENGQTLGELCVRLGMTRQAVSKHLAILEDANLVATVRRGREKLHYLNPVPIHEIAERWIGKFERSRLQALSDLKKNLEARGMSKPKLRVRHLHPHHAGEAVGGADRPANDQEILVRHHRRKRLEAGSPWALKFEDGRIADIGEILETDPPRRLVIRWRNEFKPELKAEGYSRCTMEIEMADYYPDLAARR